MEPKTTRMLSLAVLAFGIVFYLANVAGLVLREATPPTDVGLVSTTLILVLFGSFGFLSSRQAA